MNDEIKQSVAETGRILLEKKLVARTWGNISARIDETHFAITPSGLGYEALASEDIPVFNMEDDTWEGKRKPSSEKRIHGAAYKIFPDVNFVIHTHQDYATAIGLVDAKDLIMSDEEKSLLGNIEIASYGLPGTKALKKGVETAMNKGSKVVLMIHHGAVIGGTSREDAIHKAEVLEEVCKKTFESKVKVGAIEKTKVTVTEDFERALKEKYHNYAVCEDELLIQLAEMGSFKAQTDDMAQMLGGVLKAVDFDSKKIFRVLEKQDAVLVKGLGCVVKADDSGDVEALQLLIKKAALAKLYTQANNKKINLSGFDCWLMRTVYKYKYSKKKSAKV